MSCGNPGKNGRLAVLRSATISLNPTEDPCSPGAATQRHTTYDNPGPRWQRPVVPADYNPHHQTKTSKR